MQHLLTLVVGLSVAIVCLCWTGSTTPPTVGSYWAPCTGAGFLPCAKSEATPRGLIEYAKALRLASGPAFALSVARLVPVNATALNDAEAQQAFHLISMLAAKYLRWQTTDDGPARTDPLRLPASLAVPLDHLAQRLDVVPSVGYASLVLDNCVRKGKRWSIQRTIINNSSAEAGFYEAHCNVEAAFAPAIDAGTRLLALVKTNTTASSDAVLAVEAPRLLHVIADSVRSSILPLKHMHRHVRPADFFFVVRPAFKFDEHGRGVVFEGVDEAVRRYAGPTGAQTSSMPFLDAILGVSMTDPELHAAMAVFRRYWPREHRRLIEEAETRPVHAALSALRSLIIDEALDDALTAMAEWRAAHVIHTDVYITQQLPAEAFGTGGSPFARYLCHHAEQTTAQRKILPAVPVALPPSCLRIQSNRK